VRFVDTNVLLYAVSRHPEEQPKRTIANELLDGTDLALSAQVLQEFYVQATRTRASNALTHRQAAELLHSFARFPVQPITSELVQSAVHTGSRYRISYWDAAIIEAARMLGCTEVLSEDLSHGQDYGGVVVANPFQ
jgi:predicted nucleic acid-binding protein